MPPKHFSLATFLSTLPSPLPAASALSSVHRGTLFEYTCLSSLEIQFPGLVLTRVGGAHDGGIDLSGSLTNPNLSFPLRVAVQCKFFEKPGRVGVRDVRELEGAMVKWEGEKVGMLCVPYDPNEGLLRAVAKSALQMAVVHVRPYHDGGGIASMVWNARGKRGVGQWFSESDGLG